MTLKREDIITNVRSACEKYDIDIYDVCIQAGAAMVMLGLREETGDIDCTVPEHVWDEIHSRHPDIEVVEIESFGDMPDNRMLKLPGEVDLHVELGDPDTHQAGDITYTTAEALLDMKRAMNRVKDLTDIAIIEKYLKRNPVLIHDEERYPHTGYGGLPGKIVPVSNGAVCDEHTRVEAVARLTGETDSWGSEFIYLCQECLDAHREEAASTVETCDVCGGDGASPCRDPEEGNHGPIHYLCPDHQFDPLDY